MDGHVVPGKRVGRQALIVFALAVSLVYLVLAGQYESWTTRPPSFCGSAGAAGGRGRGRVTRHAEQYLTQVGIVLVIARPAKRDSDRAVPRAREGV